MGASCCVFHAHVDSSLGLELVQQEPGTSKAITGMVSIDMLTL